jgi:hypothetical protein
MRMSFEEELMILINLMKVNKSKCLQTMNHFWL